MTYSSFNAVQQKAIVYVSRKFGLDRATAEDFACRGLEYAVRYLLKQTKGKGWNEKDAFGLSCWKACNLVKDGFRRHDALSEAWSLDETCETDEGESAESPLTSRLAFEKWRDGESKAARRDLGKRAYARLGEMFAKLGLSPLRRTVFCKVYLEGRPVAEVCSRLGITPNYAYGIVFGVKRDLAKIGRAILAAT